MSQEPASSDALDPIKIRADIAPSIQAAKSPRAKEAWLRRALVGSVAVVLVSFATPFFSPLDTRASPPLLNSDQVVIYTDPPGAELSNASLNNGGNVIGLTGTPLLKEDIFKDSSSDAAIVFLKKQGYVTQRQTLTPLDLGTGIWPQAHQSVIRLEPSNPLVTLSDYFPKHRPLLFAGICLGTLSSLILGLLLWRLKQRTALQERVRQQAKEEDPLTGLSILGHEVLNRLGKGATAYTYRAVCEQDWSTMRVLRFQRIVDISDQEREERRREIGIHQKLDHPNIVKFFEAQSFQSTLVMVMEYIDGGELEHLLKPQKPLSPALAMSVFEQIASALDYAHQQGVTHRDLKPANIMLRRDKTPAVIDFGMAKDASFAKLTQTGVIKGTLLYMAPEQIIGVADRVGPRADQFAFGLMLYQALSGSFAYQVHDEPMAGVLEKIHGDAIPLDSFASRTPKPVVEVVMKMIAKDPDDRFASVSEGMDSLREAFQSSRWDLDTKLVNDLV